MNFYSTSAFSMIPDIITVAILIVGAVTGLWAIHNNQIFFTRFNARDILSMRLDSLVFVIVMWSTGLCFIGGVIRFLWLFSPLPVTCSVGWHYVWLFVHSWSGIVFSVTHVTANKLLDSTLFCSLCLRPLSNLDGGGHGRESTRPG